jgi:hypothetical protein
MFDYSLKGKIKSLQTLELQIITDSPPVSADDWNNRKYEIIKQRLKKDLYHGQYDRCAYCRKIIEGAAKYEPLEHQVARTIKPKWMLEPKNLIVTCDSCNNLKNDDAVLAHKYIDCEDFPDTKDAFLIFNPHYESWEDHLQYEDELFLTPVPNSKGDYTIKTCKLYRFNIIINRAKEAKLGQGVPSKKIIHRLTSMDKSSKDAIHIIDEFILALDHFLDRMEDNKNYT